jgi:histidine kinase
VNHTRIILQAALALQGLTEGTGSFHTSDFDEAAFVAKLAALGSVSFSLSYYWAYKLMVLYILERHDEALSISKVAQRAGTKPLTFAPAMADYRFYEALLLASLTEGEGALARQRNLFSLRGHARKLKKWADNAPMNFRPKYLLVSAELARLTGDDRAAMGGYEEAIALAHKSELLHDEAIALELAGRFFRSRGLPDIAVTYLARARQAYARWGAHAKVALLDQAYPGLASRTEGERCAMSPPNAMSSSSSSMAAVILDVPSMIKASQALSSEVSLDKLLLRLMQIVAENTGAERGVLVLQQKGALAIVAQFTARGGAHLPERPEPLAESDSLSPGIVTYVFRSCETVVLNDATSDGSFTADPYVTRKKPKAVLCAPLLEKGAVTGALYLENNLVSGAFTRERAELLSVLCAQMAISIDNAYLYADLEQKVIERTRALREAQVRLVQLEKEATEIQMAGGFAHEMRNALASANASLSTIYRNTDPADSWSACAENSGRLRKLVLRVREEVSEQTFDDVSGIAAEMDDSAKRIDKVLSIIDRAVNRGFQITRLILDYARIGRAPAGSDAIPAASLVNKVLDPFKEDFAAHRISVAVDIPEACILTGNELHLYAILQHLVNNARDALCEVEDNGERAIRIRVVDEPGRQVLSVSDNGIGIAPELHEKIFQPFFSTNPATGTGLGLGMSRKLASLYGGKIEVDSAPLYGSTFRVILPKERLRAEIEAGGDS